MDRGVFRKLLLAAMLFLMLPSFVFSAGYLPFVSVYVGESFLVIYGFGLAISIFLIAISYMAGMGLNIPAAKSFANEELVYFIFSIVILMSLMFLDHIMNELTRALTTYSDYHVPIKVYLNGYQMKLMRMYMEFEIVEFIVGLFSSINYAVTYSSLASADYLLQCVGPASSNPTWMQTIAIRFQNSALKFTNLINGIGIQYSEVAISASPAAGLSIISSMHTLYVDLIGFAFTILLMLESLLDFAEQAAWNILIPLGLVFMSLPFFRRVGASILALAIVMYYVFPLSLFLGYEIYLRIDKLVEKEEMRSSAMQPPHLLAGMEFASEKDNLDLDNGVGLFESPRDLGQFQSSRSKYLQDNPSSPEFASVNNLDFTQGELDNINDPDWKGTINKGNLRIVFGSDKITLYSKSDVEKQLEIALGMGNPVPSASTPSQVTTAKRSYFMRIFDLAKASMSTVKAGAYGILGIVSKVLEFLLLTVKTVEVYHYFAIYIFTHLSVQGIYIIFAFMQPVISLIAVVSSYRNLSSAIGGEVDLFGLLERL